jgi:branched-chain amino acid transport system ATP-binding protein
MSLLEVENVHAGYVPGLDILRGVDLTVEAQQTYCIIGPNGAGKSTLLKVICGLLKPREGSIRFEEREISGMPTHAVLAEGVSFVPQDHSLFPDMTVRENLRMGGFLLKDKSNLDSRVEEALERFPILRERATQAASALSGGQQQMLAIARTLILRPTLIMLDEPSLGLAPKVARQVFESIDALRESGITIVIVEQNARLGLEASDWGIVMDLGQTNIVDSADSILHNPQIRELYLGRAAGEE